MVPPIPTRPADVIRKAVEVAKDGVEVAIITIGAVEVARIEMFAAGLVVPPRPRLPELAMRKTVLVAEFGVEDATMKSGVPDGSMRDPSTESRPDGDDVPMPKSPCVTSVVRKFAESMVLGAL